MSDELQEQGREITSDEVLAVLISLNGGEIVVAVDDFASADINGKYLAVEPRDNYKSLALVLVDDQA